MSISATVGCGVLTGKKTKKRRQCAAKYGVFLKVSIETGGG